MIKFLHCRSCLQRQACHLQRTALSFPYSWKNLAVTVPCNWRYGIISISRRPGSAFLRPPPQAAALGFGASQPSSRWILDNVNKGRTHFTLGDKERLLLHHDWLISAIYDLVLITYPEINNHRGNDKVLMSGRIIKGAFPLRCELCSSKDSTRMLESQFQQEQLQVSCWYNQCKRSK